MTRQTLHINLLQRQQPQFMVAWSIAGLLAITVLLLAIMGRADWQRYAQATASREATDQQLAGLQKQFDALNAQKARSADALALRAEVDALKPQAAVAQALSRALGNADADRSQEFSRGLQALVGAMEPGLWLTGVTVSSNGRKIELQGLAASGATVLRFARRVNEALEPLTLRLDTLELQPAGANNGNNNGGAAAGAAVAVSFRLS